MLQYCVNPRGKNLFIFMMFVCLHIIGTLAASLAVNTTIKLLLQESADNHVFKYVMNKLYPDQTDFETRLYICNAAFQWLDSDTYMRLCDTSVLPLYLAFIALCAISYIIQIHKSCNNSSISTTNREAIKETSIESKIPFSTVERPDLCFHVVLSVVLGVLAMSTLRMKCFWTPYLCVIASVAVADPQLWSILANKVFSDGFSKFTSLFKYIIVGSLILFLGRKQLAVMNEELSELREFYDPDTVDLMHWIQVSTESDSVFSGSMQLMAGVKLCTDRTIANHPHFEDAALRDRTRELYQFYGKVSPEEVYTILLKYEVDYIILEDSICYRASNRCGTVDTVDLANWHIPEDGIQDPSFLVQSDYPRLECNTLKSKGDRGNWVVYYTSPQSFTITFSYSLA